MKRAAYQSKPTTGPVLAMTVLEAAAALRLGRSTVLKEIDAGRLKIIRCGRRVLVPRVECERWIAAKLAEGPQ